MDRSMMIYGALSHASAAHKRNDPVASAAERQGDACPHCGSELVARRTLRCTGLGEVGQLTRSARVCLSCETTLEQRRGPRIRAMVELVGRAGCVEVRMLHVGILRGPRIAETAFFGRDALTDGRATEIGDAVMGALDGLARVLGMVEEARNARRD